MIGETISHYRILEKLGAGGMGEVYKAEDIKLSQTVALKFLPDHLQKDSAALERFHAEVRNARQVSHVNVCRVFDIGEIDGRHFLSMEYVGGDDLSSLLRRVGRFSSERAVELARQLCVGLSAIHNAGILHRDFKPANVIIDSKGKAHYRFRHCRVGSRNCPGQFAHWHTCVHVARNDCRLAEERCVASKGSVGLFRFLCRGGTFNRLYSRVLQIS